MKQIEISGHIYKPPIFIAGPCVVQSDHNNVIENAHEVKKIATMLRGGAFKPRSDPKSFQGLGEEGLKLLVQARDETNLPIVTEIMDASQIELFKTYDIDVWQIGARSMTNFHLLNEIGRALPNDKAILLKRSFSATKKELLFAIEYLTSSGARAEQIMVCERGIRTFASGEYDRFTFDVDIIADLANDKNFPHLVIADPSHAAGRSELIENISLAAMAAGADGLIIETMLGNADRNKILCDANQATKISDLKRILDKARKIAEIR